MKTGNCEGVSSPARGNSETKYIYGLAGKSKCIRTEKHVCTYLFLVLHLTIVAIMGSSLAKTNLPDAHFLSRQLRAMPPLRNYHRKPLCAFTTWGPNFDFCRSLARPGRFTDGSLQPGPDCLRCLSVKMRNWVCTASCFDRKKNNGEHWLLSRAFRTFRAFKKFFGWPDGKVVCHKLDKLNSRISW